MVYYLTDFKFIIKANRAKSSSSQAERFIMWTILPPRVVINLDTFNRIYLSTYLKLHFPQPFLTLVLFASFSLQVGDNVRNLFGGKSLANPIPFWISLPSLGDVYTYIFGLPDAFPPPH